MKQEFIRYVGKEMNSSVVRILWLAHRDPMNPRAGGAERTIYEVCIRLVRKGHQIIILTGGWKGRKSVESLHGIEIHRFGKKFAPHFAAPVFLLKYHYDLVVNDLGHSATRRRQYLIAQCQKLDL